MKLIFVRHGQDDGKYRGGWSSLDLTAEGKRQVKQLSGYISNNITKYNITKILASDLPRTMTTAKVISEVVGIKVEPDKQLREMNNGDLAGMLNDEALAKYPGLFFNTLKMDEKYPNGESPIEFFNRIQNWYNNILNKYKDTDENIIVVTHSGVINIIYHLVKNIEWSNKTKTFKSGNCSIHILNTNTNKFEVENEMGFLRKEN